MTSRWTRRQFMSRTGVAAAALSLPLVTRNVLGANDRLDIACIGVGNRGHANLNGVRSQNIVAMADIDDNFLGKAHQENPKAQTFNDYRVMIDRLHPQIDAVVVATPDHSHAPAALHAMRHDKHVYCEKPLAHNVSEVRLMTEVARQRKLVTQMGTQIHAGDNYRRVVELIQAGAIGQVKRAHSWVGGGYHGGDTPAETPPVPEHVHWDLFIGTAPMRPYHPAYHPFSWRGWWDFGGGMMADMACHHMDILFWSLGLTAPTTVAAKGPEPHPNCPPKWLEVDFEFPARGDQPPVQVTWYHGDRRPAAFSDGRITETWGAGSLFEGDKGMLLTDYGRHVLLPAEDFADYKKPKRTIARSVGHHNEWIQACKTGGQPLCHFDYAGPLTEAVLLGNVAHRLGNRKLNWDSDNLRVTNAPDAQRLIMGEYRKGWEIA